MRNISFTFKHFDIDDSHCAMKVGTDGVIIGSWANCENVSRVLDIGCGSGLISLMIAQRCGAKIDAIDIDLDACRDAINNVKASKWQSLINVIPSSLEDFTPTYKYDLIISNPPFFSEGEQSPVSKRALARHEGSLNYLSLIDFASRYLTSTGHLSFIYPSGREDEIIYKAEISHLKLRRYASLFQKTSRQAIRSLFEFHLVDGSIIKENIIIKDSDGQSFTPRFSDLCKDFYLEL